MMVFKNDVTLGGFVLANRWISEDGQYVIARYSYWRRDGGTCGPADKCEPWFAAYRKHDGKALAGCNTKIESFERAAGFCMDDRNWRDA